MTNTNNIYTQWNDIQNNEIIRLNISIPECDRCPTQLFLLSLCFPCLSSSDNRITFSLTLLFSRLKNLPLEIYLSPSQTTPTCLAVASLHYLQIFLPPSSSRPISPLLCTTTLLITEDAPQYNGLQILMPPVNLPLALQKQHTILHCPLKRRHVIEQGSSTWPKRAAAWKAPNGGLHMYINWVIFSLNT